MNYTENSHVPRVRKVSKKPKNAKNIIGKIETEEEDTILRINFQRKITKEDIKEIQSHQSLQNHGAISLLILYLHAPLDHSVLEWAIVTVYVFCMGKIVFNISYKLWGLHKLRLQARGREGGRPNVNDAT